MEDNQIIELYWKRSSDAIFESNKKYGAYCFSVAKNILGNIEDSEESVNDTWLNAWNSMPPHHPDLLRMFFVKITRRVSFDKFKMRTAQKRGGGEICLVLDELKECISSKTDVEGELIANELSECINRFIRILPEMEGDIFLRRYFFTEPIKEIAENYGVTANNVAVILNRTRKKLKNHLEKEGYFNERK